MTPHWEHFDHDADIGVRGIADTAARAFEQAALAMTAVICDPARIEPRQPIAIRCDAAPLDFLFVDWLNTLVVEMATRDMLFSRFDVSINEQGLVATAYGEPVEISRHEPAAEVKGATFSELNVGQRQDGAWLAQCIVDV